MKSQSKKSIIIISFQFPPLGITASQRPYAWSKYFSEFEYHPTIITPFLGDSEEKSLTHQNNSECDIYRIKAKDTLEAREYALQKENRRFLAKCNYVLSTVLHFSYLFGPYKKFLESTVPIIENVPEPKVLLVTAMPFGGFRLAHDLHKKTGIKWIADYRDDWTTTERPNAYAVRKFMLRFVEPYFEKKWVSTAAGFTSVSNYYVKKIGKFLDNQIPGVCIENGYFEEQFKSIDFANKFKELSFVYVGSMYGSQDIRPILSSLDKAIVELKYPSNIRVYFLGTAMKEEMKEELRLICTSKNLELEFTNWLPKEKALEIQNKCHVGIMVSYENLKGIPSSKLYEFLGGNMPVLLYPSDHHIIHDTLAECGLGIFSKDEIELQKNIRRLLSDFLAKGSISNGNVDLTKIEYYSRRMSTARLAKFVDKILQ